MLPMSGRIKVRVAYIRKDKGACCLMSGRIRMFIVFL